MATDIKITDNSKAIEAEMKSKVEKALETVGLLAEGYAKQETPVDTGRLRNSISHEQQEDEEYIGTNVEYAQYVEYGDKAKHITGNAHFLRNSVQNHKTEYTDIIKGIMKE